MEKIRIYSLTISAEGTLDKMVERIYKKTRTGIAIYDTKVGERKHISFDEVDKVFNVSKSKDDCNCVFEFTMYSLKPEFEGKEILTRYVKMFIKSKIKILENMESSLEDEITERHFDDDAKRFPVQKHIFPFLAHFDFVIKNDKRFNGKTRSDVSSVKWTPKQVRAFGYLGILEKFPEVTPNPKLLSFAQMLFKNYLEN